MDENVRSFDGSSLLEHKYVKFVEKRMDLDHKNLKKLKNEPGKVKNIRNDIKFNTSGRSVFLSSNKLR